MEPQPEDEDAAPAVRLSSITGLPRERCAELLEAARGDLDLAASRAFKLQQLERLGAAGLAAPDPMAAPPAMLTILGGVDVQYPRASASILAQHIYLVVELRGEKQRTEAVRRTARPRWAQAQFEVKLPADGTAAEVRLTMCDLDDNVIGSGEAALEVGEATSSADVQLLSAADLPEQCGGVAGVIQLELRAERVLRERRRTEGAELDTVTLSRGGSAPSATSGAGLMARQMRPARGIEGGAVAGLWSRCDGCQSLPQKGDGESQLADLRDCPHAICRHCLVQATADALSAPRLDGCAAVVLCPVAGCDCTVDADELHALLPPDHPVLLQYAEESLSSVLGRVFSAGTSLVTCPMCASSFAVRPGTVGELTASARVEMADASDEALADFARHRVRCPDCSLEFCSSCSAAPFHYGHASCQAAARAGEAYNCRFW